MKKVAAKRGCVRPDRRTTFLLALAGGWFGLHLAAMRRYPQAVSRVCLPVTAFLAGRYAPYFAEWGISRLLLYAAAAGVGAGVLDQFLVFAGFGFLTRRREGWRRLFAPRVSIFGGLSSFRRGFGGYLFDGFMRRRFGRKWWSDGTREPETPDWLNAGLISALLCAYLLLALVASMAGAGWGFMLYAWFIAGNAFAGVLWLKDAAELSAAR